MASRTSASRTAARRGRGHARLGVREPLELNQLCGGFRGLGTSDQALLLRRVLDAFGQRG
jgi:hypothetical protein